MTSSSSSSSGERNSSTSGMAFLADVRFDLFLLGGAGSSSKSSSLGSIAITHVTSSVNDGIERNRVKARASSSAGEK